MSDRRDKLDEESALAAEYALGLLDGADLDRALRLVGEDNDFAREVARWRGLFAALHNEDDGIGPPDSLWSRIEAGIAGRAVANDNVSGLRWKLKLWRSATGVMTALAASLAMIVLLRPQPEPAPSVPQVSVPTPAPLVALMGDKDAAKVVVSWDPSARQLVLAMAARLPGDAAHSHELWVIPADGKPRSLGVLSTGQTDHKRLAEALARLLQQGATIAISVEPQGGSPTGTPTGPVVASGALTPA